jgi:hypothetical protein
MQKPKQRDVEKRLPRAAKGEPTARVSSLTKVADQAWKLLDNIEIEKFQLTDFDMK